MLRHVTPFRQLARLYRAALSASESLSKLSDREAPALVSNAAPLAPLDVVEQRLNTHEADIQHLAGRIRRLETLGRHLRLQAVANSERPFLIEANVPGLRPLPSRSIDRVTLSSPPNWRRMGRGSRGRRR